MRRLRKRSTSADARSADKQLKRLKSLIAHVASGGMIADKETGETYDQNNLRELPNEVFTCPDAFEKVRESEDQ